METLKHSSDSANSAFYFEDQEGQGLVWCEVLHEGIEKVDGRWQVKPVPDYHVRVYKAGVGEVGHFTYTPDTEPKQQILPDRTVTRLVREHLEALEPATAKGA